MEQLFWRFQAYLSNGLFNRFPSKLSLMTNHLLENVAQNGTKLFNGPYIWWFLDDFVTLGCKEHHLSCTHRVFWSEYGRIIDFACNFCFRIFCFKHF